MQRTIDKTPWWFVLLLSFTVVALLASCGVTKKSRSKEFSKTEITTSEKLDSSSQNSFDSSNNYTEEKSAEDFFQLEFDTTKPATDTPRTTVVEFEFTSKAGEKVKGTAAVTSNQPLKSLKTKQLSTSSNTESNTKKSNEQKFNTSEKSKSVAASVNKSESDKSKWNLSWWWIVVLAAFWALYYFFGGRFEFITSWFKKKKDANNA